MVAGEEISKVMVEVLRRMESEIEAAIETLEILSDEKTLKGIEEGLKDIKKGDVLSFEEFLKKYGYK